MKVRIEVPPNSSILSSMLYEGLLFIKSECDDDVDPECLKKLWDKKHIDFNFVRNDIKYEKVRNFNELIERMKKDIPQDLEIYVHVDTKSLKVLVGSKSFIKNKERMRKDHHSFQIMKVDRYKGITSTELDLTDKQVTVWADSGGVYIFFLGLVSAYVTAIRGKGIDDYYFLFFDTSELPFKLRNPKNWMVIKENVTNELREVLNKMRSMVDEAIALSVLLNSYVIESIKEQNVMFTNLRLVKISRERDTYKVYNDMPLSIFTTQKIYMSKGTVENLQKIFKKLIDSASRFINGTDRKGDGYHAYIALRYLYNFIVTSSNYYLEGFYREIHEANRANPDGDYLLWVSKRLI
ncbi:MAG: hypothetical protein QXD95_07600 [Nitrososphaeria archaeon]